jgi:hypothetical protein
MRPQLIIDCGGVVHSALLVTADGELVPCSQEVQQVATRHVSPAIFFEPRVVENSDFIWEDALETLSKARARNFFQRARRIGLRRPWDPQTSGEALQLAAPLAVLSSPAALADRVAAANLPQVGFALLDALLEPVFAFVAERLVAASDIDAFVVLPARTGRRARLVLQKVFRHRGVRRITIVRRETAAAMALIAQTPCACIVVETSRNDLHVHRVDIDGDPQDARFRTTASVALTGLGWNHWLGRIAEALDMTASAAFGRSLTALLTGSPDSLPPQFTHAALLDALDETWIGANVLADRFRDVLAGLAGQNLPLIFAGELFTLARIRALFGVQAVHTPLLDDAVRNVALAAQTRFTAASNGGLRVNTFRGTPVELLAHAQLPAPGEACRVDADFRLAGDSAGKSFLLEMLWGDATLCAMPLELHSADEVRLSVHLRRSRGGSRLHGTFEARVPRDVVVAHSRFTEELEVTR